MVEDLPENLLTARRLGMRTVWIAPSGRVPAYVDVRIGSLRELRRQLERLT